MAPRFFLLFLLCFAKVAANQPTILLLIRHGETNWNLERRCNGITDIELNQTGIAQANHLANYLIHRQFPLTCIYSSPLKRAYFTATATAERFALPIYVRPRLQEMNFGKAEGTPSQPLSRQQVNLDWDNLLYAEGETLNQLITRVKQELIEIATYHSGETVAIFTHGKVITTLLEEILNFPPQMPSISNCSVVQVTFSKTNPSLFTFIQIESTSM